MHAQNSSRDLQAKLIVRSVVKWREFRGNKKIATTLICYARLTQDSRNALNWSRTVKSAFLKFIRPDFWMDLNGCRQRLLFAHQLTQQKCSLCSQGMSWQVTSINTSANQNAGFVMEYQVHNPFNQHFWKFLFEVKWNGLFRFSPMEIFGITCEGGPLWLRGLAPVVQTLDSTIHRIKIYPPRLPQWMSWLSSFYVLLWLGSLWDL